MFIKRLYVKEKNYNGPAFSFKPELFIMLIASYLFIYQKLIL